MSLKEYMLFLLAACMSLPVCGQGKEEFPQKTFQLSFEKGLTADYAKGNPEPVKSKNVTLVDGISGKGAYIPQDGYLLYELNKNFPQEHGTLIMWMKPDWTSQGRNLWVNANWRGIFSIAKDGDFPGKELGPYGSILRAMQDAMVHYAWFGKSPGAKTWDEAGAWHNGQTGFTAGTWRCHAYTWDSKRGIKFYLDGKTFSDSKWFDRTVGDANGFYLGSAICLKGVKGYDGIIDEVAIYDDCLTKEQIQKLCNFRPISNELMDYAIFAGNDNALRLKYHNISDKPQTRVFTFSVKNDKGREIKQLERKISLKAGKYIIDSISLNVPAPGLYSIAVTDGKLQDNQYQVIAISPKPLSAEMPLTQDGVTKDRLIETIDCSAGYGPEKYRDDGKCKVEKSALGQWRVSEGGRKLSGFAYLMNPIPNPGKPHWLEIEYPDNAQRAFYVAVFQENGGKILDTTLDTIGVLTGDKHPLTNTIQKKRLLFWPDSKNLIIGCYIHTPYPGENGPALARINLYEIEDGLPRLDVHAPRTGLDRLIGVWNEDPTMPQNLWFNLTGNWNNEGTLPFWETKLNRMAGYLHYTGQNLWSLQNFAYGGDRNTLPATLPQTQDSDQRTAGWADLAALIFQRENISFYLEFQDVAFKTPNAGGKPYQPLIVAGFGKLIGEKYLSRTLDEALAKGEKSLERFSRNDNWSEAMGQGSSPTLEPLQPLVQAAYLKLIRDSAEKFSVYKSFKGIGLLSTVWSHLMYSSLNEGYGDYPVKEFEKDTGIIIPVAITDRKRFSKRYDWLMANVRDKWIQWRTKKLTAFYSEMVKTLQSAAPGRNFVLMDRLDWDRRVFASWPAPDSNLKNFWLERGLDIKAAGAINGFLLMPSVEPNFERTGLEFPGRASNLYRNERYYGFSPELAELFNNTANLGAFIVHQSNYETYGDFAPEQVTSYFYPRESKSKCHMAFSNPLPDNKYVLEHLTRMLADFNPSFIFNGWWGCPDNGAVSAHLPFYRAFRSIPMLDFKKVPGASDPVQVKYGELENAGYILIVNREYYPVSLNMTINSESKELLDLTSNTPVKLQDGRLSMQVKPYEVICLKSAASVTFKETAMTVPPEVIKELEKTLAAVKQAAKTFNAKRLRVAGLPELIPIADAALAKKQYSYLHYLLQSGPATEALKHENALK